MAESIFGEKRLYLFHRGQLNDDRLFYTSTADGVNWGADSSLPAHYSYNGPSAVAFKNEIYLFHRGSINDQRIWYTRSSNGSVWSDDKSIDNHWTRERPAAAASEDKIYCVHRGMDMDENLYISDSGEDMQWSDDKPITFTDKKGTVYCRSEHYPAVCYFNGRLYCVHKGQWTDNRIFYTYLEGEKWAVETPIPGISTQNSVSLAVFNGKLFCAHRGNGHFHSNIYIAHTGVGNNWVRSERMLPGETDGTPALCTFNSRLYCAYRGNTFDDQLYITSTSDGENWAEAKAIHDYRSYASPTLVVSP